MFLTLYNFSSLKQMQYFPLACFDSRHQDGCQYIELSFIYTACKKKRIKHWMPFWAMARVNNPAKYLKSKICSLIK